MAMLHLLMHLNSAIGNDTAEKQQESNHLTHSRQTHVFMSTAMVALDNWLLRDLGEK
jgi:hypothetical protein